MSIILKVATIATVARDIQGQVQVINSQCSLVPRPFPPPVFDHLQYKNGGEGLGERVTCVTSGRREGRREGGSARQRISRSFL